MNATSPAGALVDFTAVVTAYDDTDPNPTLKCTPASGSQFAIGDTTVSCVATDAAGNRCVDTAYFAVHVLGAPEQLANLETLLDHVGPGTSLRDKIADARTTLARGDEAGTYRILRAFTSEVKAQSGVKLTTEAATSLIADATRITDVLGY